MAKAKPKGAIPRKKKATPAHVKAAADRAERRSKGEEIVPPATVLEPPEVAPSGAGRPTLYKPEYAAVAKALCKRGATDYELAKEFEVTTVTIWRWQVQHEEFCNALKVGKDSYDDRVERGLAQRALGYTYDVEKIFCHQGDVTKVQTVEHIPPDPGAAKLWLTNRRPKEWRDTQRHEHSGPGGGPIEHSVASDIETARRVAFALGRVFERQRVMALDAAR